jgi:hypothetical protein
MENLFKFLVGTPARKNQLEEPDVDDRTILKSMLNIHTMRAWTGFIYLKMGTSGGLLKRR